MQPYLEITLILSAAIQAIAAILALHGLQLAGSFRLSWICISIALFLMLQRRLVSTWHAYAGGQEDPLNTVIGLAVSVFMLCGIVGLKRLFQVMHEHKSELEKLADTDFLTGVHNRRYFMQKVTQELTRAKRYPSQFSLLMLDIDFFKRVNDSYGHRIGDIVLQHVAHYCQNTLRSVDILGRIGGEEFAVFLPEADAEKALEVAERLRQGIQQTQLARVGDTAVHVTVSIGLVSADSGAHSLDDLLDRADKALYAAKAGGRNKVCRSQ